MNNVIFQNAVGTIYNDVILVKGLSLKIDDLSVVSYTIILNGKLDFFLIILSIVLSICSLVFLSFSIMFMAITFVAISKFINIKYYYIFFGVHKKQQIIIKEINKVKKKDVELFIEKFNIVKCTCQ